LKKRTKKFLLLVPLQHQRPRGTRSKSFFASFFSKKEALKMPGPLEGIRILEFEGLGPAPFCAMLLAGLGADILRVTRPDRGPHRAETGDAVILRGRDSVAADLKSPDDRAKVLQLIAASDALLEGFRPGVMERLGLGPDICLVHNPRLVYGRMTGWGQTGALSARAGHDINYIALTGALHAIGGPDTPAVPLNLIGDYGGGAMFLAVGVLAALLEAQKSARGQVVDAAMTDGAALLMSLFHSMRAGGAWADRRAANLLDGGAPFYRCYACADGRHIAVGALEPQFFKILLSLTGIDFPAAAQHDRARWPDLAAQLETVFKTRPRDDWAAIFEPQDGCVSPILSIAEAPAHPHNRSRGTFVVEAGLTQAAPAPRFSRSGEAAPAAPQSHTLSEAITRWSLPG
jgi:alpha-methylacyl-CoA racemase